MILGTRNKDTADKKTLTVNWATYLTSISDTMSTNAWTVPSGLTTDATSSTSVLANVRVSGGVAGELYAVANVITTTSGEVKRVYINVAMDE